MDDTESLTWLPERAVKHILYHRVPGSDPGLCVAEKSEVKDRLVVFNQKVTGQRVM